VMRNEPQCTCFRKADLQFFRDRLRRIAQEPSHCTATKLPHKNQPSQTPELWRSLQRSQDGGATALRPE
jgi:hypothetical protein